MIIAQLSDVHARPRNLTAYGNVDTNRMLQQAVAAVLRMPTVPDCVLITGDLTDCGREDEYAVFQECVDALPMPVFVIPGNHDRREPLSRALGERHSYLPRHGPLHYVIDSFPVRLIALDSVIAGETHGALGQDQLAWLDGCLAEARHRPTMLLLHHPPFLTGVASMDEVRCIEGAEALSAIVARHPQIERVVAGHYHRPICVRYAGTLACVAPSTAHQVALDFTPGVATRFVMEPPGFCVHTWSRGTGVVTHTVPIGDYGAPFEVTVEADYPGRFPDERRRPAA